MDDLKLSDIGEKELVRELTDLLDVDTRLIGGFGHDSAFIDVKIADDEVLLLNTDRSGMNVAYKLGLDDGESIGDFAVSHAISDILASGGDPVAVSIALLLPPDLSVQLVKKVMLGAQSAAKKYGAFIASGDTKHSPKFAVVVTAVGKCKKANIIKRTGAKDGDLIAVSGTFGNMLAGFTAFKNNIKLGKEQYELFKNALIYQNPPYMLTSKLAQNRLINACMDNSDGISSSVHALSRNNALGAVLFKDKFPIHNAVKEIASELSIDPFQMCLSSGDWQHIYSISEENIEKAFSLANDSQTLLTVIGRFTANHQDVVLEIESEQFELKCIENDRFLVGGTALFDLLSRSFTYLGPKVGERL